MNMAGGTSNEEMDGQIRVLYSVEMGFVPIQKTNQIIIGLVIYAESEVLFMVVCAKCEYLQRRILWEDLTNLHTIEYG